MTIKKRTAMTTTYMPDSRGEILDLKILLPDGSLQVIKRTSSTRPRFMARERKPPGLSFQLSNIY
jgi:hypothetical protein